VVLTAARESQGLERMEQINDAVLERRGAGEPKSVSASIAVL
jgi:hypothetical protein